MCFVIYLCLYSQFRIIVKNSIKTRLLCIRNCSPILRNKKLQLWIWFSDAFFQHGLNGYKKENK